MAYSPLIIYSLYLVHTGLPASEAKQQQYVPIV